MYAFIFISPKKIPNVTYAAPYRRVYNQAQSAPVGARGNGQPYPRNTRDPGHVQRPLCFSHRYLLCRNGFTTNVDLMR